MKKFTDIKKSKAPKAGAPIWAIKWPAPKEGYRKITKESVLNKVTLSPESIAKKHGVSLDHIESQLEKGIKVEQEHTSDKATAREIALDHLGEVPDYYTKLKKVEEAHNPHTIHLVHGTAQTYDKVKKTWKDDRHDYKMESGARKKTLLNRALAKLKKDYPHHAEHEVKIHEESVLLEFQKDDLVTIHYGAHNHEPHRVTAVHPGNKLTILPTRPRGRANRYPGGELTVDRAHLHPFEYQITELHDEPDRPGVGIGSSNREGMSMTEEPRKTLRLSKADWDHHTRHATAQYDHEGKPWIVKKDTSGAAIRIPVQITENDYPHRETIWKVLKEALPKPEEREDNAPPSKTSEIVKGAAKKDKSEKKDDTTKLSIGKTKDTFEPEPVLTPVLSIANMPGGAVK